jgi:GNAT superfamily N-acetyltransferase
MKINDIYESTTSGSVATVAQPMTTQARNASIYGGKKGGNLLTGKKTSKKYANSLAEAAGEFKGEHVTVLYIDDKPAVKYTDITKAKKEMEILKRKLPSSKKLELKQEVREAGMPQSVLRNKQKLAKMTDAELADHLKGKSDDELKRLAWRHGYGNMSSHYVNRIKKVTESTDTTKYKVQIICDDGGETSYTVSAKTKEEALRKATKFANDDEYEDFYAKIITEPNKKSVQESVDSAYKLGRNHGLKGINDNKFVNVRGMEKKNKAYEDGRKEGMALRQTHKKVTETNKKSVQEGRMKEIAMDIRDMDNGNFQKKYKKSKEQLKRILGDPDKKTKKPFANSITESNAANYAYPITGKINPEILSREFKKQKDMGWYKLYAHGDAIGRPVNGIPTLKIFAKLVDKNKPEHEWHTIGEGEFRPVPPTGPYAINNKGEGGLIPSAGVEPEYQRKGIASAMYQFVRELGNAIVRPPSGSQSDDAVGLWKSFEKKGIAEAHLEEDDLILVPGQGHRLKSGFIPHGESRLDHEVEMAKSDLFSAAKNAKQVYEMIADVSEEEGLEGWVQEKIIKANDYLNTIREYLEGKQLQEMTGGVIAGGGVGESADQPGSKKLEVYGNRHGFYIFLPNGHVLTANKLPARVQRDLGDGSYVTSSFGVQPDPDDDKEEWDKLAWNVGNAGPASEGHVYFAKMHMKPVNASNLPPEVKTQIKQFMKSAKR